MRQPPSDEALIALGSNIRPREHLAAAIQRLADTEGLHLVATSGVWRSEAIGSKGPPFLNAAVRVRLSGQWIDAERLKYDVLRPIEAALGRTRGEDPNAARTIDLDLSMLGATERRPGADVRPVVLPDPEVLLRPHVAWPLAEVAPDWRYPGDGRTIARIAAALGREGIQREPTRLPGHRARAKKAAALVSGHDG